MRLLAVCVFAVIAFGIHVAEHEYAGFVEWARSQIELYAEMFRKQVYSSDIDQRTIEDAIKITELQSKKVCSRSPSDMEAVFTLPW